MAMIRKCGISNSPTRTPLLHHHRRMTLGMLLVSATDNNRKPNVLLRQASFRRNTLKELMSSTNLVFDTNLVNDHQILEANIQPPLVSGGCHGTKKIKRRISRPATPSAGFRLRFLKRPWRPLLDVIPEGSPLFDAPITEQNAQ
ncbi:unnamed protein product [Amaranthus hypochondriacus]